MPIDYEAVLATSVSDEPFEYTEMDSILYALGVGFGSDPLDRRELSYVYEQPGLHTVPTMAGMLLSNTFFDGSG